MVEVSKAAFKRAQFCLFLISPHVYVNTQLLSTGCRIEGGDPYNATPAVTWVLWFHLMDCYNLLAISDKQRILWTNFFNPNPHYACNCHI